MKTLRISFLVLVLSSIVVTSAFAKQVEISGKYCYQYGDSESLMIAKEISYAMALRKAIETYKTFVTSTSIIEDFQMKKDIIETIASGYVDNVKVINQDVQGRTVCTSLVGYVNPDAVKSIITRKVDKARKVEKQNFKGIISNNKIKILNYRKGVKVNPNSTYYYVDVLYQAKTTAYANGTRIIIDCFDKNGLPLRGSSKEVPYRELLKPGEVRSKRIFIDKNTAL